MKSGSVRCATVAATERVAAALARHVARGQLVVLTGGLGAGKTTFVKAYAASLGVDATVTSPSYTLVHHYRCAAGAPVEVLLHADLWRLQDVAELGDLALDEPLDEGAAAIVEWGERFDLAAGREHVVVAFGILDGGARELVVDLAHASLPDAVLDELAACAR
jgi:tRNA threonylcarbamoyladenosine biosynthesis protein TsaE